MTPLVRFIIAGVAFACAGAGLAQPATGTYDRKAKDIEEERIEAEAKAAKENCNRLEGNAEDVCEAEAKAREKIAKAELDAKYDPSPRNQRKLEAIRAEGQYEVAKERCQDLGGTERAECRKRARARYDQALAEIDRRYPGAPGASIGGTR